MKALWIVLMVLTVLVIITVFFTKIFPKLFWANHAKDTKNLQVRWIEGITDIEYEYGQDLKEEVKEYHEKASSGNVTEYVYFYPQNMDVTEASYPVVVWGNGTGNTYVNYEASLKSLASYGFVVVGCDDSNMGDGRSLYEMACHVRDLNVDHTSLFFGRLDTEHFGVGGHSQGACAAVNAATRFEESALLFKSLFTTSLPKIEMCVDKKNMAFAYWKYDVSQISMPYFATSGTKFLDSMWISPLSSMEENWEALSGNSPAYMAREIGANHNIVNEYHGCGYFNAWFCYTLKGDMRAAQAFTGKEEIRHNTKRWKDFKVK